jgi:hypothetical protein
MQSAFDILYEIFTQLEEGLLFEGLVSTFFDVSLTIYQASFKFSIANLPTNQT